MLPALVPPKVPTVSFQGGRGESPIHPLAPRPNEKDKESPLSLTSFPEAKFASTHPQTGEV